MKIAILYDQAPAGADPDLADNTVQAEEISDILTAKGHLVIMTTLTSDRKRDEALHREIRPDLVFNLVEAPGGQGRFIADAPEMLERLDLPYTGAGPEAMRTTSNKLAAKHRLKLAGLPTPCWIEEHRLERSDATAERYIIKSVWEHGSIGLDDDAVIPGGDLDRLHQEMARRRPALGGECFSEEYVEGREFNISLLAGPNGPAVLPPAEILFDRFPVGVARIVGYQAKWSPHAYEYNNTPRRFDFGEEDRELLESLSALSLACWRLFGLRGWARVDFRVNLQNEPMILEVNANPCLSSDAGFMAAAARSGLKPGDVLDRIIEDASNRPGPAHNGI